jgi:hypothetical protein
MDVGISFKESIPLKAGWNAPGMLTMNQEQKGRTWGSLFKNEKLVAGYLS